MTALWKRMVCAFAELSETKEPDGEGGWNVTVAETREFDAALATTSKGEHEQGGAPASSAAFTLTAEIGDCPKFGHKFKRVSDGAVFKATSNPIDARTPAVATFSFEQVTCERVSGDE